ncbi:MAG: hypothetical protein EP329_25195 [Deltaproteobacteria bacterium]|nr:MAG: hypothetical protein EP329_25195 [Deltaproteobacteria bacterium]
MLRRNTLLSLLPFALLLTAPACDDASTPVDDGAAEAVLPGKADNYLSPTSREYKVWGDGQITLDREAFVDAERSQQEAEVRNIVGYRVKAYTYYVNAYLTDKGHGASNADYGGFGGFVRGTTSDFIVEPVDDEGLNWIFLWEVEMGGPRDLLSEVPKVKGDDGTEYVIVKMPKLTASQLQYGSFPKDFDPATYTGEMEELQVIIEPTDESFDGYPEYDQLFDDGLLDVVIVVGGDYNDARYDIQQTEDIFGWLKSAGYTHEATQYTDLKLDSAPFKKSMKVNGHEVAVEITLVWGDIVPIADIGLLRQRIIEAYENADIVIYNGHAGEDPDYSGVVYHYNPRHAISATQLGQLDLPDRYQIYLFNGCKTYAAYPEAVMANTVKTTKTVDIVSTVNFSWLSQQTFTTSGFIRELLALSGGTHDPRTWREVLTSVNARANYNVYYGVHGIDDNPHMNPYADPASLCASCSSDNDCPGAGNLCVKLADGGKHCAAECTADDGCPDGYVCGEIAIGYRITGHQCLPKSYRCE